MTLGTGAFVLAQAGGAPPSPPAGILASCAWRRAGAPSFALEGFIPTAGAAVDWFARIGALPPGPELDPLLASGTPGVVCVPALQGLGTPGLGGRRARRRARAEPRHDARRPRPRRDRRHPAPGRRRGRRDGRRCGSRRCGSTAGCRARTGSPSGSPTSPACASSARRAPTRPRWAPPPWRASPRGVWDGPTALPDDPARPRRRAVARARRPRAERDRWAAARELTARWR